MNFRWFVLIVKNYLFYVVLFIVLAVFTHKRRKLAELAERWHINRRPFRRLNTFEDQLEQGLNSENFSISDNLSDSESRTGLDEQSSEEIHRIMETDHVSFDEARRRYFQTRLGENGIDESGVPTDPRTVTWST